MNQNNLACARSISLMRGVLLYIFISGLFVQSCEDPAITNPSDPNYELLPPTLLSVEALTDTSIAITWKNNEEHTKEFVIKRKVGSSPYAVIGTISKDTRTFIDSTCELGTEYTFIVKSKVESNLSANSNAISEETTFKAPSHLSVVTLSETSIQLTWQDNCDFEDGYRIERDSGSGFELLFQLGPNVNTVVDSGLVYGIDYSYRVLAFTSSNTTNWETSSAISINFPAATDLVTLALNDSRIQLNWNDNSHNEEGFKIERNQGSGYIQIEELKADIVSYIDSGLVYGPTYTYRIAGYKGDSRSSWAIGDPISTTFPTPSNLHTTAVNDIQIELSWEDNCSFESGYKVERDIGSGFDQIAVLDANIISYSDMDLEYGLSYTYRLKAFTDLNESYYSNESVAELIIPSPTNLTTQVVNNTSILLAWDDNCSFEGGYDVERRSEESPYSVLSTLEASSTSFLDADFNLDVDYTYRIAAFTDENFSDYSNESNVRVSSMEGLWNGIWKITSTTNSSAYRLSLNETLTFSSTSFDGHNVTGIATMVSIMYGEVSGPFTYNPTGQTLVIGYTENPYERSYNNVTIDETSLNFSNGSDDFTLTEQQEIADYDASTWMGTWKVTSTTNSSAYNLSMDETLTFNSVSFNGHQISGSTVMASIMYGVVSGPFTYNPTGQTLVIGYTENPYGRSYNNVTIDETSLNFSNGSDDFTLTRQWVAPNTVTDIEGNVYQTLVIGEQEWMIENLRVTHYRDGTAIPNLTSESDWINTSSDAYAFYNNNVNNGDLYGALYNWYSVGDSHNLAPEGWHIPTIMEWQELFDFVGGAAVAGGKLKEVGTLHWLSPNTDATDEYGFSALPSGERAWSNGNFQRMGEVVFYWSASSNGSYGSGVALSHFTGGAGTNDWWKENGYSVRCVKD